MITKTLFGLACLIANGDPKTDSTVLKAERIANSLPAFRQAQVQTTIESGACLPDAFSNLIEETRIKIEQGAIPQFDAVVSPSDNCL